MKDNTKPLSWLFVMVTAISGIVFMATNSGLFFLLFIVCLIMLIIVSKDNTKEDKDEE